MSAVLVYSAMLFTTEARALESGDAIDPQGTLDILFCQANTLKQLDAELNNTYQKILKSYDKPITVYAGLIKAQRTWIKLKQADCKMPLYLKKLALCNHPR